MPIRRGYANVVKAVKQKAGGNKGVGDLPAEPVKRDSWIREGRVWFGQL